MDRGSETHVQTSLSGVDVKMSNALKMGKIRVNKVQRSRSFSVGCVLEDIVSDLKTKKRKLDAESTESQTKKVAVDTTNKESDAMLKSPQPGPSSHAGRPYTETDRMDAVVSLVTDQVELMQKSMQKGLEEISDKISDSITHNLKKMVKDMITTMMDSKMKQIKTDMDKRTQFFEKQLLELKEQKCRCSRKQGDLEERLRRLEACDARTAPGSTEQRQSATEYNNKLVIMNLSEGNRENLQKKIEALMREGLKITDIMFENIERKVSRQTGRSGIVIVTCMSWADKDRILKAKRLLDQSRVYRNVSIKPDRSREQRTMENNMRSLATAVGMVYRGGRLMNERREHVHNRHHHRRQHEHSTHHNNKDNTAHKDSRGNDNVEDGQRRYFGRNPSDAAAGHRTRYHGNDRYRR